MRKDSSQRSTGLGKFLFLLFLITMQYAQTVYSKTLIQKNLNALVETNSDLEES